MAKAHAQSDDDFPALPVPALGDYDDVAGAGYEQVTADDIVIPLLRILQSNSPQVVQPAHAGGIEGARAGQILNISTLERYDGEKGLVGVPVFFDSNYVEYTPRDAGGGFVGIRPMSDLLVIDLRGRYGRFGKLPTETGTELVETKYLFFLFHNPESPDTIFRAVPTFSSTQIKKATNLVSREITTINSRGQRIRLPLFAHKYRLGTKFESNKKGQFYGWDLRLVEEPPPRSQLSSTDPLFLEAREFYQLLTAGKAVAAKPTEREPGEDEEEIPM